MLNQPKFKSYLQTELIAPDKVFLLSEQNVFLLQGKIYYQIVPLINGKNTSDEIVQQLQLQEQADTVLAYYALMQMEKQGYIVEAETEENIPLPAAAFWEMLNLNPSSVYQSLQTTEVSIKLVGQGQSLLDFSEQLKTTLESLQISVGETGAFEIIVTDDYLNQDLEIYNQKNLQNQRPWMLVKPVGIITWIGPIFEPEVTGCWQCLAQRLKINRPVEAFIEQSKGQLTNFSIYRAALSTTLQAAIGIIATAVARWLVKEPAHPLTGQLLTLDHRTLTTQNHTLTKRPQCPCCGESSYYSPQNPTPVIIESCKKNFTGDGGHRNCSPEITLQRYQHHISPILGVIRELKRMNSVEDHLNHTYAAFHNLETACNDLEMLRSAVKGGSGGKGKTEVQAKASGLCEALERYSGIFEGYELRKSSSYEKMGQKAIHPHDCMLFSQQQYENRQEWNAKSRSKHKIPEPFDPEKEIEWTPIWSLSEQTFKYLPTAYCYYNYPKHLAPFCRADSNGNAAGNTVEEAILQGFMELVERDAVALWWYNRIERPGVDLSSFPDSYPTTLQNYYAALGRELWVLDLTNDLNIPVFAALSRRVDNTTEDIIYGFGAHFDPQIALLRAVTELNQILPLTSTPSQLQEGWQEATLKNQPYLAAAPSIPIKVYKNYDFFCYEDVKDDILSCIDVTGKLGLEMLVLDQTRPDIDLKVVKVIVPGLRHFWPRFGNGRLYEVPVKLGWLAESLPEEKLNPLPMIY